MRKLIPTVAVILLSFSLSAQYKKASFFGKEGRTYELGSRLYMMGEGNGNPIGFKLAFGRDQDGKRWFTSWNLQVIPPHNYSYSTVDEFDTPLTVSGQSRPTLVYGMDWGYHILKNEGEDRLLSILLQFQYIKKIDGARYHIKGPSSGASHIILKIIRKCSLVLQNSHTQASTHVTMAVECIKRLYFI